MSRPRVLIVDADDDRRETLRRYLSSSFEVLSVPLADRAADVFARFLPDAVIAHVRQPNTNGFELCQKLRGYAHGPSCMMVVHGHLRGPRRGALVLDRKRREAEVDVYLAREVDEIDLEQVLGVQLLAPEEAPVVETPRDMQVQFMSARKEQGDESVDDPTTFFSALRQAYGGLIDYLPEQEEVTWGQLMRARANLHNMRVLLTKPVTPLIERLPEDRDPTTGEVLRAKVTMHNMQIILRRRFGGEMAYSRQA